MLSRKTLSVKLIVIGKVGRDVTVEQAYQSARSTGLQLLAVMAQELGSLDSVRRIVKVTGFVNAFRSRFCTSEGGLSC